MNEAIASILKSKIENISYADRVGALVRPVGIMIGDTQKVYPVSWDVSSEACLRGAYNDLMPNSNYKSLMYFEDEGVTFFERKGNYQHCISRLKLVGWVNMAKFSAVECPTPMASCMILEIIKAIPATHFNEGIFQRIKVNIVGEDVKSNQIFARYTYSENMAQYLFYPYDYFALSIQVNYAVNVECLCGWDEEEPEEPEEGNGGGEP